MRNYVIINGVNSLTIQGLAINNLPPITKPMIRTQREEIDGRDGDIVTELGYSAYDKQIEIGLWGTYDINDIIKYFTGEGTIVFSNEEDKYYNFKILDQIDYQKLLKFKTATITFHCQPFKYPLEEEPVEVEITTLTGTGETITLNNTEEAPMKIDLKGNTSQEGTPTPEIPQDIHVVSGDNSIEVGNNVFDISTITPNSFIDNNGNIYASSASNLSDYIEVKENDIILSYDYTSLVSTSTRAYCWFDSNKNFISGHLYSPVNKTNTFSVVSGAKYIRFTYDKNISDIKVSNKSASYPINLGDIELCKIGDYQDKIVKDNGKWYLNKQIGKVVFDGTQTWQKRTDIPNLTNTSCFRSDYSTDVGEDMTSNTPQISNLFECLNNTNDIEHLRYTNIQYYRFQLFINKSRLSSDDETGLNNFLSSNNMIVYYVLATQTYTEITDSTLISQLEALESAMSYKGQTNISQTNNDLPFELDVSVTFLTPMEINNIGNIYAKPILTIEGTGNIGVVLNDIQILNIDLTNNGKIAIDVTKLEAYNPDDDTLLNRLVTGDYMKLLINEGENTITFTGNVSSATLTNYIRWI